jgi:heme-degrading monooxygenase HmoA
MDYFNPSIQPPYYAVIFYNQKGKNLEGYKEMDDLTLSLAQQEAGYLGHEYVSKENQTLFISYWKDMESIHHWKKNSDHILAKQKGIAQWYDWYSIKICKVEYHHIFNRSDS